MISAHRELQLTNPQPVQRFLTQDIGGIGGERKTREI